MGCSTRLRLLVRVRTSKTERENGRKGADTTLPPEPTVGAPTATDRQEGRRLEDFRCWLHTVGRELLQIVDIEEDSTFLNRVQTYFQIASRRDGSDLKRQEVAGKGSPEWAAVSCHSHTMPSPSPSRIKRYAGCDRAPEHSMQAGLRARNRVVSIVVIAPKRIVTGDPAGGTR